MNDDTTTATDSLAHLRFQVSMLATAYLMAAIKTQRYGLDCRGAVKVLRADLREGFAEFEWPAHVWKSVARLEKDAADFSTERLHDLLMYKHESLMQVWMDDVMGSSSPSRAERDAGRDDADDDGADDGCG